MAEKKNKGRVVAFRLTDEEFAPFGGELAKTNMTISAFFREVFLSLNVSLIVNSAPPKDYKKLVFIYNKASININQLSYMVNRAHRTGIITEALYRSLNNSLVVIRDQLLLGVSNAH
ncbi:hypothetical protein D3C75_1072750 [compost metagenome]|jgi:hypothetical protein